ncbi:MAG: PhnD/SsuA/transferrin family substrate-binding protein [Acidimicrobiales bacterium]|nr:PhnD/SsuA/transferrin family substrate-binding protein [Acidimicrobiales bacterium]
MTRLRLVSYLAPGFPAALFQLVAERLNAELTLIETTSGPPPGEDPFADGTFDIGWICSTSFVDLALRAAEPSVVLTGIGWTPRDDDSAGRPVYFGDLAVRCTSPVRGLADLRGARIGCNDPVSLSGHYAVRFAIDDLGEDPDSFADLIFTGGHRRSLDAVLAGEVDAAVVDSIVLTSCRSVDPAMQSLRVVQRLGPWPVQPLVARADLNEVEISRIRRVLLELNEDPIVLAALKDAALVGFVPTAADHYGIVRSAMQRVR